MNDIDTDWFDHYQTDRHHRDDWWATQHVRLSDEEYATLAAKLLSGRPEVAALRYPAYKRQTHLATFAFHAPLLDIDGMALDNVTLLWEPATGQIWHLGRLDLDRLADYKQFIPLTGDWK